MPTTTPAPDIDGATIAIGDKSNGLVLLVIDGPDGRTFDLEPIGAADVIDEGVAAIRLNRELAAKLATELFGLLTGRP